MKNIKENIRGFDHIALEFNNKTSTGEIRFINNEFQFTHTLIDKDGSSIGGGGETIHIALTDPIEESFVIPRDNQSELNKDIVFEVNHNSDKVEQIESTITALVAVSMQLQNEALILYPTIETLWDFKVTASSTNTDILDVDAIANTITLKKTDLRYFWYTTLLIKALGNPDKVITHRIRRVDNDALITERIINVDGGNNKLNSIVLPTIYLDNTEEDLELYVTVQASDNEVELQFMTSDVRVEGVGTVLTPYIRESGEWNVTNTPYKPFSLVTENGWTGVSKVETYSKLAPVLTGDAYLAYDGLYTNTEELTLSSYITVGQRYTTTQGGYWKSIVIDILHAIGYEYRIIVTNRTDALHPVTTYGQLFTVDELGIYERPINNIYYTEGETWDILLQIYNHTTVPVNTDIVYNYRTPDNIETPISGDIVHANKVPGILNISEIDFNDIDRSAFLSTLKIGDTIKEGEFTWEILSVTQEPGYYSISIEPTIQLETDGVKTFTFSVFQESTIEYGREIDIWASNPNVSGLYGRNTFDNLIADNHAYMVTIEIQNAVVSKDWHIISHTEESIAGGGGGASETAIIPPEPWDGTLYNLSVVEPLIVTLAVNDLVTSFQFGIGYGTDSASLSRETTVIIDNSANTVAIDTIIFSPDMVFALGGKPTGLAAGAMAILYIYNTSDIQVICNWQVNEN